jgi:hypothetical protein
MPRYFLLLDALLTGLAKPESFCLLWLMRERSRMRAGHLDLYQFDSEFSARTSPDDWQRILVLRDHPRMLDGVLAYDTLVGDFFAGNILLNRVVVEFARFQMIVYMLYLYDTADPNDPRTGLTVSRLQQVADKQDLLSRGGIATFVGLLRLAGYLHRLPSPLDKRVVHLAPAPKFLKLVEEWNRQIFRCIDTITPDAGLERCHGAHPRFGWEMRGRGAEALLAGWKPLDPFPATFPFFSCNGGFMLLLHAVAKTIREGKRREIVPVAIDLGQFGKRFGASRSQLRRLLESAFTRGDLLDAPKNGANIVLSPRLLASFVGWTASELGNYRLWGLAAKQDLGLHHAELQG